MKNKIIPSLVVANILATAVLALTIVDNPEESNETKTQLDLAEDRAIMKSNTFVLEETNPEHKYIQNIDVAGEEVLAVINTAVEDELAIFVVNKSTPSFLNAYGLQLGDGKKEKYHFTDVYAAGYTEHMGLMRHSDYTSSELDKAILNSIAVQDKIKYEGQPFPILKHPDDASLNLTVFETEQKLGEPVTSTIDVSTINPHARYISAGIVDKTTKEIIGYVFEQYGMEPWGAYVATNYVADQLLPDLTDYQFDN